MWKIEQDAKGGYQISDGKQTFHLSEEAYNDLYHAIPIDNSTLALLIQDTLLSTAEDRHTFKAMLEEGGGLTLLLSELQRKVMTCPPVSAAEAVPEAEAEAAKPSREEDLPVAEVVSPSRVETAEVSSEAGAPPAASKPKAAAKKRSLDLLPLAPNEYWLTDGDTVLGLKRRQVEDLLASVPVKTASLFRLINDTLLSTPKDRELFKNLVKVCGGVEAAMKSLTGSLLALKEKGLARDELVVQVEKGSKFSIACGGEKLLMSKNAFCDLRYSFPMSIAEFEKTLLEETLKEPSQRRALMRMVQQAGDRVAFLTELAGKIEAIDPVKAMQ